MHTGSSRFNNLSEVVEGIQDESSELVRDVFLQSEWSFPKIKSLNRKKITILYCLILYQNPFVSWSLSYKRSIFHQSFWFVGLFPLQQDVVTTYPFPSVFSSRVRNHKSHCNDNCSMASTFTGHYHLLDNLHLFHIHIRKLSTI